MKGIASSFVSGFVDEWEAPGMKRHPEMEIETQTQ